MEHILGVIFGVLYIFCILFGVYLLLLATLGGLFLYLDVTYPSFYSLALFVGLLFIIGGLANIHSQAFSMFVLKYLSRRIDAIIIQVLISFAHILLCMFIVDWMVPTFHISTTAMIITSLFLAMMNLLISKEWQEVEFEED